MSVWDNCEWARLDRDVLIARIAALIEQHEDAYTDAKETAEEILGLMRESEEG